MQAGFRILLTILAGFLAAGCQVKQHKMKVGYPDDLHLTGSAGGQLLGTENQTVEIRSNGNGWFTRYLPDNPGSALEQATFEVSAPQLKALWAAIEASDFFSLEQRYEDPNIDDGAFASLTIAAHARTHQVMVKNTTVPRFQVLIKAINRITPPGMDLRYEIGASNE